MKHFFTLFASLLFTATFAQQKLIAIKGTTTDAIATTLEQAISIAQPNDKIYLPGGTYTLNDSIQKPVHIIGTGYNDLIERQLPITIFAGDIKIGSQSNGLILEGIKCNNEIKVRANNVTLKKIYAPAVNANKNNLIVIQSIFSNEHPNYFGSNATVFSSIIYRCHSAYLSTFVNCVIFGIVQCNIYVSNTLFQNCIIHNWNSSDCLTYCGNISTNTMCAGNNSTTFSNYFNGYTSFSDLNSNFSLSPSAPIQNIGIYHGTYPWKNGGQPINPHITANNSFLDVQNEQFKLKVKVIPQTN
jgi:hypothetical protein